MSKTNYAITVVARTQDNGDGSYTTYVYNDHASMLEDHYRYQDAESEEEKEKIAKVILSGEDEYEYGYLNSEVINIEVDENGKASLVGSVSFDGGQ